MMMGNGPPRSGWLMKVVVWPSLVGISICWSIMGVSRSLFLALAIDTIARKPEHDKATCRWPPTSVLNPAAGIAIVLTLRLRPTEIFEMTQTSNRFFDEI